MTGGGVCAVLDYEVDMMAEYVAEMAVQLVTPRLNVTAPFRKFVSQILTSTRLPKTTILLGMNYLSKRVNGLKRIAPFHAHEGQVWRMLTIALLLGSKFLDDNTFQNRSWSEVSGISVSELNKLEAEWLRDIQWNLYVNLERSEDYNAWLDSWSDWMNRKKMAQTMANRERAAALVTPIQTDFARSPTQAYENQSYEVWRQQQVAEYERLTSLKRNDQAQQQPAYRPYDNIWNRYPTGGWANAPLTPPDSGYGTPEYLMSAISGNTPLGGDSFARAFRDGPGQRYMRQGSSANMYHQPHNPLHYPGVGHMPIRWEMKSDECNCGACDDYASARAQPYFFAAPAYGQAVMG